jgi:hypothetical protein
MTLLLLQLPLIIIGKAKYQAGVFSAIVSDIMSAQWLTH